eukprot:CAMPEP_0204402372 /NCGR_PEP_ID=MMETSP0470-20130426/5271_1 /ASSEMBLY_ACC=CAM_ASM_000385 /TAXON_ID=2969 /ORGANISM="Oxyrrhis marina" /LENGTH=77 /DNA_ID=CAMNT_0051397453 /DNA_START=121 /DNA_END=354 /DNA_ORIENTATION=-
MLRKARVPDMPIPFRLSRIIRRAVLALDCNPAAIHLTPSLPNAFVRKSSSRKVVLARSVSPSVMPELCVSSLAEISR